ncbi:MAG: hypothetical protein NVV82_01715 [Sporocytophaga sp.]|nr:hypothetical protein [Sporocytophaga sp.]
MLENAEHFELLTKHIPSYLTLVEQEKLVKCLEENFPNSDKANVVYIELEDTSHFYQGDLLFEIPFPELNLENGQFEINFLTGCVLSNTCDIAPENKRIEEPLITIAPVIPLDEYVKGLDQSGINLDRIKNFVSDLKSNRITNLLYFPKIEKDGLELHPESFVRFDYPVALPASFISKLGKEYGGDRIVSLSNYGFYLLIFKLSIHYCRLREGVFRNN